MERGDIVTLAAGVVIVILIAVAARYGGFLQGDRRDSGGNGAASSAIITPVAATPQGFPYAPAVTTGTTAVQERPDPVPYRIYYSDTPLEYPVFRLPENMETFGASELPWKNPDIVPFAYVEESRSGLTRVFTVPYGLWRLNISVDAWKRPQYARFDMVLCYAADGTVIDGAEILNRGTVFRNIQVSNKGMYLIIHTENVDLFRITFETPRDYYNAAPVSG